MSDAAIYHKRDRSPSFPFIGIGKAVERTRVLYKKAKRHDARIADVAGDWGLAPKSSSTLQTVGALIAYGLVEDSGSGEARKIKVSDMGARIIADDRPGVREELLAQAAMKPKLLAEYAERWAGGRPDDSHAISQLKFDSGFTDEAAYKFLRIFDETSQFTNRTRPDVAGDEVGRGSDESLDLNWAGERAIGGREKDTIEPANTINSAIGERILTTGILSKTASFRLLVTGPVGEKEIDRLIKKLQLDKEILSEAGNNEDDLFS